jgi:hypothetical protein
LIAAERMPHRGQNSENAAGQNEKLSPFSTKQVRNCIRFGTVIVSSTIFIRVREPLSSPPCRIVH